MGAIISSRCIAIMVCIAENEIRERETIRKQAKQFMASVLAFLLITSILPELNEGKAYAATSSIIDTVAGLGSPGYSGDGGPATSAEMNYPTGVAVDSSGNLYIAEYANNLVRKVDASGQISTVAGTGSLGFSGDEGPATSAQLNRPYGVAVDDSGNLYISDYFNNRIRKVDASGKISTVAGTGTRGYSGDGGPATLAQLYYPTGVAVDSSGSLYIVDNANNRIRKVDTSGQISTVAGMGTSGYSGDGGPATSAQLNYPNGVTVDSNGNLYIADSSNHRIRKVDTSGTISTVAGNGNLGYSGDGGPATWYTLNGPTGVAVDGSGNLYIADNSNNRIRKVDVSGMISTIAGTGKDGYSGDGGPATSAQLRSPYGVVVESNGNLYLSDGRNHRVRKLSLNEKTVGASASTSTPQVGVDNAITMTVKNAQGNTDTTFNGAHDVTITGYLQAPDNSFGSLDGIALSASPNTISVTFASGVATVNLRLNKAATQSITLSVAGVTKPAANTLIITPIAGNAASMALTTDITPPVSNGGMFAQQPVITLHDVYGNTSIGDDNTVVIASKKDTGAWTLTGTSAATASAGVVTFTGLGATNAAGVTGAQLAFEAVGLTPIESKTVMLPWPESEVEAHRIGDLPVGAKIRDSVDWDYFSGGSMGSGGADKEVYKSAPITWILVDKDKHGPNKSLFVTEEIVAETNDPTAIGRLQPWIDTSLRKWLRETFYPKFSPLFQRAISITTTTGVWNDTLKDDTFFVLSAPELDPSDQSIIPYFKDANNRKANGNQSEYHWTRTESVTSAYYLVNNSTGDVGTFDTNSLVGIRPAVNVTSDTIVKGPFIDSDNGSSYYKLANEKYRGTAEFESPVVRAGEAANILFQVRNADGSIDITFNQQSDVAISGYVPAPDGTAGSFANEELTDTQTTIRVTFTNGVARVPLVLHAAAKQILHFHIKDLLEPDLEAIEVQPTPHAVSSVKMERQPIGPVENGGGLLRVQPALKVLDKFGNPIPGVTVSAVKKDGSGDWTLVGNAPIATDAAGIVSFTGLGAINSGTNQDIEAAVIQFFIEGITAAESEPFQIAKDSGKMITKLWPVPHDPNHPNVDDPGKFRQIDSNVYITDESSADLLISTRSVDQVDLAVDGIRIASAKKNEDGDLVVVQGSGSFTIDSSDPLLDTYVLRLASQSVPKKSKRIDVSATSKSGTDSESIVLMQAPTVISLDAPDKLEANQTITISGSIDIKAILPIEVTSTQGKITEYTDDQGFFSFAFTAPSSAGNVTLTVEAPGVEQQLVENWDVMIYEPFTIIAPDTCNGTTEEPFSCQLVATGGIGDRIWTIESGSLPEDVYLDSQTGLISGIPIRAGTYPVTIAAIDSMQEKRTRAITINIEPKGTLPAPRGLKATAGDGEVVLSWEPVAGATYYDIYEGLASGSYQKIARMNGDMDSYSVTGLSNDITYFYAVKAGNSDTESDYSTEVSATPQAPTTEAPEWPDGSKLTVSNVTQTSVKLSWPRATDHAGVTGYRIYIDGEEHATVGDGVQVTTIDRLSADTRYKFKVTAYNAAGLESEGLTASATTLPRPSEPDPEPDSDAPEWPDGSVLTVSNITQTSLKLSWPGATDNEGVKGYRIYVDGEEHSSVGGSVQATTIDRLIADTRYKFKVTAYDAAGNESEALTASATTLPQSSEPGPDSDAPQWPEDSELTVSNIKKTSVKLSWPRATDNEEVTGYRIYVDSEEHKTVGGRVQSTTIDRLTSDTRYKFKVTAFDEAGNESAPLSKQATTARSSSGGGGGSSRDRTLSDNNDLEDLRVWAKDKKLELSPSFSSGRTSYSIRTEAEEIEFAVKPDHSAAKVMLRDKVITDRTKVHLNEGENKLVLIVQARNGSKKEYTLTIYRETPKPSEPAIEFTDIAGHWAESSIMRAAENGIAGGYPDGTFKPNHSVTRAEFIVMLAGAMKLEGYGPTLMFSDHDHIGTWAKQAVAQAVEAGIVGGYEDGSFRPNERITRAEMAVMIARALKLQHNNYVSTGFADEEEIPHWVKGAVEAIRNQNLVSGRSGNRFAPNETATRAEAATILLRMLDNPR
ncbi:fibronectin type III domain-containing protein [Brevibacillus panacihumi]|uniref:NHL domain-containing protein n=1 Tax=Brevibacillus panacihumi TaxID=497735 RepID=UPI003D07A346